MNKLLKLNQENMYLVNITNCFQHVAIKLYEYDQSITIIIITEKPPAMKFNSLSLVTQANFPKVSSNFQTIIKCSRFIPV